MAETQMNLAALTVAQLARLLAVAEDQVRLDIDEGAPTNADGTLSLVVYAAWLAGEVT